MNNTLYYGDNLDILRQHVPDDRRSYLGEALQYRPSGWG